MCVEFENVMKKATKKKYLYINIVFGDGDC